MAEYSELIQRAIKELSRLPGIGPRSAERIVFYILKENEDFVECLSHVLTTVKKTVFFCESCNNISEEPLCHICADQNRDHSIICVVEEPKDVIALEKSKTYRGVYHVLLGTLSPLNGIGPEDLKIAELLERIKNEKPMEIILATNPNTDGETTVLYLSKLLRPLKVKISRIARGVPVGSNLEYMDQATLACAIEKREEIY